MEDGSPEALRKRISARYSVRLHCALILLACFGVGLYVTHLLLALGVHSMWLRYAVALVAGYLTFLLGVRIWLRYAGFDRRILPSRRSNATDGFDIGLPGPSGGGSGGGNSSIFDGGGGRSGGGGASMSFGESNSATPSFFASSGSRSSSGGGGVDLGDGGWVLLLLVALLIAVSGAVVWLIYAAPTILADAAFAAMLSAGLVRSTRHIASGGWVTSVVGHTWIAFFVVFMLALAFAIVAQNHFPDAKTIGEVIRKL